MTAGAGDAVVVAKVSEGPIDSAALIEAARTPSDGAVLLFEGRVRRENDGRPVVGLRYEAYAEMAEAVLREIGEEAAERFGIGRVAVTHRAGTLEIGETSVAIAVAAPHRDEAYAGSRWIIEEIKRRLPVWKKEEYADGGSRWVEGRRPPPSDGEEAVEARTDARSAG